MKNSSSDSGNDTIKKVFEAKESFHKEMAKLPFEEKIDIVIKLQKIAEGIEPFNGKARIIKKAWKVK